MVGCISRSRACRLVLETFLVTSWAEHLRQHERFTRGDGDVEAQCGVTSKANLCGAFRWSRAISTTANTNTEKNHDEEGD